MENEAESVQIPEISITEAEETLANPQVRKEKSAIKLDSIHIKEERFSVANKTGTCDSIDIKCFLLKKKMFIRTMNFVFGPNSLVGATKLHNSIDDEIYECIQEHDQTEIDQPFDISIELTDYELARKAPVPENVAPSQSQTQTQANPPEHNFMIGNPVSIRPSQFPMNETNFDPETTAQNVTNANQMMHESVKDAQSNITKPNPDAAQANGSVIVIEEDTEEMSAAYKSLSAINRSRCETANSPYKNHYATNPKLNETINAAKNVDPFDMQLQNAFLDDIDFVDYISSLENVQMTTRVRPIEVNTDVQIGDETFQIVKQIGQGSFGFVFR